MKVVVLLTTNYAWKSKWIVRKVDNKGVFPYMEKKSYTTKVVQTQSMDHLQHATPGKRISKQTHPLIIPNYHN
jgi:hypothetical protein